MTTAVLATRVIAGLGCLLDVGRVIYDGVEAKEITDAEGIDIGAEIAEITFLCYGLSTPSQYQQCVDGAGLTSGQTQLCWGIVYGLVFLVTALESLNGFGDPDSGKDFTDGQKNFNHIDTILAIAFPQSDHWSGPGATAYTEGNQALLGLVENMAAADAKVATTLQNQAGQVNEVREQLAAVRLSLVGVLMLIATISGTYFSYTKKLGTGVDSAGTNALVAADGAGDRQAIRAAGRNEYLQSKGMTPGGYDSIKSWQKWLDGWLPLIVLPPCISAISAVVVCTGLLIDHGRSNADDIQKQKLNYQSVFDGAKKIAPTAAASPASQSMASACTVSGFSALAPVGSDASDMFLTGAQAAGAGARGRGQRTYVEAVGARESHGHASLAASMPQSAAPLSAPLAAAGPAGLEQSGDPVTGLAVGGRVPQMNSAGQPTGRTPQLVSQAQRRRAHVASSDPQEPATTENGATASDRYAQSVPVRVTTAGASPVQEKTWAERNLG